jgi:CRISPR-associated protein Cas1
LSASQKPGWQKTGFRGKKRNPVGKKPGFEGGKETRLAKNRVSEGGKETRLAKNRVSRKETRLAKNRVSVGNCVFRRRFILVINGFWGLRFYWELFNRTFLTKRKMATVYLLQQGTNVYKDRGRFAVCLPEGAEGDRRRELLIREVERILLFGNIQLSVPAVHACFDKGIPVLFLSALGEYLGHLCTSDAATLPNQIAQAERHKDKEFQLGVARALVRGKLFNSKQFLLRLNRKRKLPEIAAAITGLTSDLAALDGFDNVDALRGREGTAAARYFPALGKAMVNPAFSFAERNRRPPKDPVNSLLSFGYTLLFNYVLSSIVAEGLSPYFGCFHYSEDGRTKPFLAFDLMEEFRSPVVDSFVLRAINNSALKPEDFDFVESTGGVYLGRSSRNRFVNLFEDRINESVSHPEVQSPVCYRRAIELQVRRYKRCLLHGGDYEPFLRSI